MAIFKCKMCGGTLEINNNESVFECEYCGTNQTLPKLDDDRKNNMYDRANHFRRNNEFDKAMGIYEQILNEDGTDAEAYWSLVLCRYGIEYVEDPATHKRVPTVNRAQYTSIFDDSNYKSALQYADTLQKSIYEEEAKTINEIQKGILEISQKEEPFDVFICYKETDNNGRRTPDSVLANDLYHQLTQEGFKVFFARITLEDKLGSAYEPYIFAALNSAKAMVVLGTKPEFFKAVWVRNEWSRYLALIKNGEKKQLIPAYKDMDPYDLPEEFSHLQAQDMSKLGFMQDLIRGIKKITGEDEVKQAVVKETVISSAVNTDVAPLLERVFIFLEDEEWDSANEYCEKVLDIEPKNETAYLGKFMAELKIKSREKIKDCAQPFDENTTYKKLLRFADDSLKNELTKCIEYIKNRNENERLEGIYSRGKREMRDAVTADAYKAAAHLFAEIKEYKDAAALSDECYVKAEETRKNEILVKAKNEMDYNTISNYYIAIELLESISEWKDADERIIDCKKSIENIQNKKKRIARCNKAIVITACAMFVFVIVLIELIIPEIKYSSARSLMEEGKYFEAYNILVDIKGYKDSEDVIEKNKDNITYDKACTLMVEGEYEQALELFNEVPYEYDKEERQKKIDECKANVNEERYNSALELIGKKEYILAQEILIKLGDYKDSKDKLDSIQGDINVIKLKNAKRGDYVTFGKYEQDNNIGNGKEDIEWLVLSGYDGELFLISRYTLEYMPFNNTYQGVNWGACTLREWLNNDFYQNSFSPVERNRIYREYTIDYPDSCEDKVFLLSIRQTEMYCDEKEEWSSKPTKYASSKGLKQSSEGECYWWVRDKEYKYNEYAYYAYYVGTKDMPRPLEVNHYRGVRPAIKVRF